jgi:hypothetical protein
MDNAQYLVVRLDVSFAVPLNQTMRERYVPAAAADSWKRRLNWRYVRC